jgi:hypothetical protein
VVYSGHVQKIFSVLGYCISVVWWPNSFRLFSAEDAEQECSCLEFPADF